MNVGFPRRLNRWKFDSRRFTGHSSYPVNAVHAIVRRSLSADPPSAATGGLLKLPLRDHREPSVTLWTQFPRRCFAEADGDNRTGLRGSGSGDPLRRPPVDVAAEAQERGEV